MDDKILDKILNIAERFFGTADDPTQIPVTRESFYKLQNLHPKTLIYKLKNGEPISWIVILPTTKELMNKFLNGEINERELLDLTKPNKIYEALYLCSAITIPEYRRSGYIKEMFLEGINSIPHARDTSLFDWPVSAEGSKLHDKLEIILGQKIINKTKPSL